MSYALRDGIVAVAILLIGVALGVAGGIGVYRKAMHEERAPVLQARCPVTECKKTIEIKEICEPPRVVEKEKIVERYIEKPCKKQKTVYRTKYRKEKCDLMGFTLFHNGENHRMMGCRHKVKTIEDVSLIGAVRRLVK